MFSFFYCPPRLQILITIKFFQNGRAKQRADNLPKRTSPAGVQFEILYLLRNAFNCTARSAESSANESTTQQKSGADESSAESNSGKFTGSIIPDQSKLSTAKSAESAFTATIAEQSSAAVSKLSTTYARPKHSIAARAGYTGFELLRLRRKRARARRENDYLQRMQLAATARSRLSS